MKQVEITTRVKDSLENIDKILINKNFEIIRKSRIEDVYLSNFKNSQRIIILTIFYPRAF